MSLTLQINAVYSVTTDPWPTVAAAQPAAADEDAITPESFSEAEEGDVFAFEDRNHLWDAWPGRCVFVVVGSDCIYLFDSEGARIDERESFGWILSCVEKAGPGGVKADEALEVRSMVNRGGPSVGARREVLEALGAMFGGVAAVDLRDNRLDDDARRAIEAAAGSRVELAL